MTPISLSKTFFPFLVRESHILIILTNLKVRVFRSIFHKKSKNKYIIRFIYFFGIKKVAGWSKLKNAAKICPVDQFVFNFDQPATFFMPIK